jgi:hypothetical protein
LEQYAKSGKILGGENSEIWITPDVTKAEGYISGKYRVKTRSSFLEKAFGDHIVVLDKKAIDKACTVENVSQRLSNEMVLKPKKISRKDKKNRTHDLTEVRFNPKFVKEIISYDDSSYEAAKYLLKGTGIKVTRMDEKRAQEFMDNEPYLKLAENPEENDLIYSAREKAAIASDKNAWKNFSEWDMAPVNETKAAYRKVLELNPKSLHALIELSNWEALSKNNKSPQRYSLYAPLRPRYEAYIRAVHPRISRTMSSSNSSGIQSLWPL